jgi:hypothetical protein
MMAPAYDVPLELVSGQIETGPQGLRPADGGFRMAVGQKLRATSSRARVDVDRNALLDLATATELSFAGVAGRRVVELHRGSVHLTVRPLAAGRSLAVRTADATVTVHGTRFSVTTSENAPPCTTVVLDEGVVSVDSQGRHALLTAPSTWSSCVRPQPPSLGSARTPPANPVGRPAPAVTEAKPGAAHAVHAPSAGAHHAAPETTNRPPASSTLGDENMLLASARKAVLAGDDEKALTHLERLLQLYPRSVLAQNASVERLRALKRLGRDGDARKAATRYLAEYPDGFGSDEARAVVRHVP